MVANGLILEGSGINVQGLAINGFSGSGISIQGTGNTVQGNFIGSNAAGTSVAGNNNVGVAVAAGNNIIGGNTPAARNIISGNKPFGVYISGNTATGNSVLGNYIGTDVSGTISLGNTDTGVTVENAPNNIIGGNTPGAGNLIAGHFSSGLLITGATATDNLVRGNFLGTNAAGTGGLTNTFGVIVNNNATKNTIGGNTAADRNIISNNAIFGVLIQSAVGGNLVQGNFIGPKGGGINVTNSPNNTIGGAPGAGNLISGNITVGLSLSAAATGNSVLGNLIGTNSTGTTALPNSTGVVIDSASNNRIGGSTVADRNTISGNILLGINIIGTATGNSVVGNLIGTQSNGTGALGNGGGIGINASGNAIGGTVPGLGNTIANNGIAGVTVNSGIGNSIQNNSIFANVGLGIDLGNNGITANDAGDADTGANNIQNTPVLTTATVSGGSVTVAGTYNSIPSTTFTLQFFANNPPGTQGQTLIASIPVTNDAAGNAAFNQTFPAAVTAGQLITATATDAAGNTSEFSAQPVPVVVPLSTITGIKFGVADSRYESTFRLKLQNSPSLGLYQLGNLEYIPLFSNA